MGLPLVLVSPLSSPPPPPPPARATSGRLWWLVVLETIGRGARPPTEMDVRLMGLNWCGGVTLWPLPKAAAVSGVTCCCFAFAFELSTFVAAATTKLLRADERGVGVGGVAELTVTEEEAIRCRAPLRSSLLLVLAVLWWGRPTRGGSEAADDAILVDDGRGLAFNAEPLLDVRLETMLCL